MMDVLRAVEKLNLPDWWIGAGFVRSKVWDYSHKYKKRTPLPDVDLIYFDPNDFSEKEANSFSTKAENRFQKILNKQKELCVKWSVTNQARMHLYHHRLPYKNSQEALSEWAETATCIGVRLKNGKLELAAPHGIGDLVNLKVRRIPNYKNKYRFDPMVFERRVKEKRWLEKWPRLKIAF
ncbi:MAG: nucleotidyltransferase family protein [Candidatus Levybacteria bacterium]|nr:nucleotidyltransferase family protein [Candidatus Levybacteria bacterium]